MKNKFVFLFILLISAIGFSQINFEEGYLIDESGKKQSVLIKNMDWKDTPDSFEYKTSQNSEVKTGTLKNVKSFGIANQSQYVRVTVNIDRSSDNTSQLSYSKNPVFKEETIFLKVLLDAKASLYSYEGANFTRFFYKVDDNPIEQLVFKNYKVTNFKMGKNEQYKQELYNNLKCESITLEEVEKLEYQKSRLLKFFTEYNNCENSDIVSFEENKGKNFFHLNIRPGVQSASLSVINLISDDRNVEFDNEIGFRIGLEAEMVLPFNKNKWAVILEPTYQYYKSEKENLVQKVEVDYSSIEIPVGLRHYFFLNDESKIFLNAAYIVDLNLSSTINYENSGEVALKPKNNIGLGAGYNFDNKFSVEFRYSSSRELFTNFEYYKSDYNALAIIFGYTIF
ncbi:outer membrane beta-barrel protein [Aequorivita sp. Q41]|uniref:outer membrane beta-barrel protein n=1 Tax=Aequorivita sp. Q41 TaxID=3153300 RepID=UPI003242C320